MSQRLSRCNYSGPQENILNEAVAESLASVPEHQTRHLLHRNRYWLTRCERLFNKAGSGSLERNLLHRLRNYEQQIMSFLFVIRLGLTHNRADRDIRMVKLREKISGCFRNETTARVWVQCRSTIATARKQGHTFL